MATIRKNARKKIEAILNSAVLIREYKYDDMGDTTGAVTPARVIEAGFSDPQLDFERVTQDGPVTRFVIHRNLSFTAYATKDAARRDLTDQAFAKYFPDPPDAAAPSWKTKHAPGPVENCEIIEHTKGPWYVSGTQVVCERTAVTIASTYSPQAYDPYDKMRQANARLIAAAPELLESLRTLSDWMREHTGPADGTEGMLIAALAAIGKAHHG